MSDDTKKKKAPARRNRRRLAAFIIGVLLVMLWFLFGVYINLAPVRPIDELAQARAKWQAQDMDDYQLTLTLRSATHGGQVVHITVLDDQPDEIRTNSLLMRDNDPGEILTEIPDSFIFLSYLPADLSHWTMEGLFDSAAEKIKDKPAPVPFSLCGRANMDASSNRYNVDYDATLGYITTLQTTCQPEWNVGLGLLCFSTMSHCDSGLSVQSLMPLATPEK